MSASSTSARPTLSTLRDLGGGGWLAALVALLLAGCGEEPHTETKVTTTDAYGINALLTGIAEDLQNGRAQAIAQKLTPDFLHEGDASAEVVEWTRFWQSYGGVLRAAITEIDIDLPNANDSEKLAEAGATCEVSYTLSLLSCPTADAEEAACRVLLVQRAFPGAEQAFFTHLRKTDEGWRVSGDQQPFGVRLTSRHQGTQYLLEARIRDGQQRLQTARVVGPGATAGAPLERVGSGEWRLKDAVVMARTAAEVPAAPIAYELELQTTDGPKSVDAFVKAVVDDFAVIAAPSGEVAPPVTFRWTVPAGTLRRYQVKVYSGADVLWASQPTAELTTAYAGPALEAGKTYAFEIWTLDSYGDASVNPGSFTVSAPDALTPKVTRVTPATGPAAGGTAVQIEGANFQAGARVLFGEFEATGVVVDSAGLLHCTTPAHAAGSANLVVQNKDKVGLLERAFTYQ